MSSVEKSANQNGNIKIEDRNERKATNLKILQLQENLGQCHYDTKILKNEIHKKRDQKYDFLLEDSKKLGLENEKLKWGLKSKKSNARKKIKIEKDKKDKEL